MGKHVASCHYRFQINMMLYFAIFSKLVNSPLFTKSSVITSFPYLFLSTMGYHMEGKGAGGEIGRAHS